MAVRLIQITVTGEGGEFEELLQKSPIYSEAKPITYIPPQAKTEGPFCALCNQQIGYDQTEVVFHLDGKCQSEFTKFVEDAFGLSQDEKDISDSEMLLSKKAPVLREWRL